MKIKDLKKKYSEYTKSILDIVRMVDPSKNGKYMDFLMTEIDMRTRNRIREGYSEEIEKVIPKDISNMEYVQLEIVAERFGYGFESFLRIHEFDKYCNSGHIEDKDIQNYKTLGDLEQVVEDVKDQLMNKSTVSKYKKIYSDDDGWLVIKPLNFRASRKYGGNTKWCTTMVNRQNYFYQYSDNMLLYIMNTETNVKWAVLYEHNKFDKHGPRGGGEYDVTVRDRSEGELSWWNVEDKRVDSYFVIIPDHLEKVIMDHVLSEEYPNSYYFDDETKKEREDYKNIDNVDEVMEMEEEGYPPQPIEPDDIEMEEPIEVDELIGDITTTWSDGQVIYPDGVTYTTTN